ncbi:uncharacterized protein LOC123209040 [Mangifera indica]|uniref:uncharacterized protein LOC123209040 n=1 Tax=Mangifera indica TaxID=29780 RepID=UPI001CFB57DD|nr:uncharacterized protein LOC123209040 [Mangifera indica]
MEQPICSPVVQSPRTTDHPGLEDHPSVEEHPGVEDCTTHHTTEQCPSFVSPSIFTSDATLTHWGATILREILSFHDDISSQMTRLCDDVSSQITRFEDRMTCLKDIVTRTYPASVAQERDKDIPPTSPIDTAIPSCHPHEIR